MKNLLAIVVAISAASLLATAGFAQQPAQQQTRPAARTVMSLDPVKGKFHRVHIRKLKMSCGTCHSDQSNDVLFLRRNDVVPAAMPGQVDRKVCLDCHKSPRKPSWYGLGR